MSETEPPAFADLQQALVDTLIERELLTTATIEAAFRAVPRHLFLPDKPLEDVYKDNAIPTKFDDNGRPISSSSQPAMMAIMLEQLGLQPGHHVLEVGAGTGYNAALLGYLVGEHGRVTTLDIDQDIVAAAQTHLAAAGCANVAVICGDGMAGYAENGPYDRIILTVGGWEIAPAWLAQLKRDGRIVLPLSLNGPQFSIAFAWQDGRWQSASVRPCGFMRLRGPNAGPGQSIPIGPDPSLQISFEEMPNRPRHIDAEKAYTWLTGPYNEAATGVRVTAKETWRSLLLWLALHEADVVDIGANGEAAASGLAPYLLGMAGETPWRMAVGVVTSTGMAYFVRPPGQKPLSQSPAKEPKPFALYIRAYGEGDTAGQQLQQQLQAWAAAGRPNAEGMRVQVYPLAEAIEADTAVTRRWHTFVIDWPEG